MPTRDDAVRTLELLRYTAQQQASTQALQQARATTTLLTIGAKVLPGYRQRPHTDLLAEKLTEAVLASERGEDARVIVEMPPGFGKSSVCSVALPLWTLQRHPSWEVVLASAEASLATKWSRDCRRVITDGMIPGLALSPESRAVTEWETTEGGSLIARGVGGQITGRRARLMLIDDPVKNLADAHSQVKRDELWNTWQSVLKTRLRPGSVVVLVMTRWHEDDLAGRLLKSDSAESWTEIRIPAIAEEGDPLGRAVGEPLLSPMVDETPEQALTRWAQVRSEVGTYVWDALYQQRPSPPRWRSVQIGLVATQPRPRFIRSTHHVVGFNVRVADRGLLCRNRVGTVRRRRLAVGHGSVPWRIQRTDNPNRETSRTVARSERALN